MTHAPGERRVREDGLNDSGLRAPDFSRGPSPSIAEHVSSAPKVNSGALKDA